MSSFNHNYPFFFAIFSTAFIFPFITSAPLAVGDSPYVKFIDFLSKNNCTMPKEVALPFPRSSDPSTFNYLSTPLEECRTSDALTENDEANLLCREVFDVLQNITCFGNSEPLPEIDSNHLSENICKDFKSMRDVFPKRSDYLSGKLVDGVICKLLCTKDKYELLCKTLLWSYDTQTKIKIALENEVKENKEGSIKEVTSDKAPSTTIKLSLVQNKSESNNQELNNKVSDKLLSADNKHPEDKNSLTGPDLNNSELGLPDTKILSGTDKTASQTTTNKMDSSTNKNQDVGASKTVSIPNVVTIPSENESEIENQKLSQEVMDNKNVKTIETNSLSSTNLQDKHIDHEKNEINIGKQSENVEASNNAKVNAVTNANILTSNNNGITDNQNGRNISEDILQNKEKNKGNVNSDSSTKASVKSDEAIAPNTEIDNELNNINLQEQENEAKIKQTEKTDDDKDKKEKPKLIDFVTPNEASPDIDSKLPESSTLQIPPDEDAEQHQDDKDQDQYNDTENDGDYPKAEYDNSFNPPPRNREPDVKSTNIAGSSQISNSYDTFISPRNNIGRVPDDIPMIPSFPEQEDNHFFFYFLSIVLILMAGYLIFHNKQKIIALIVEGRHERRRRSHGAGYKKLETK